MIAALLSFVAFTAALPSSSFVVHESRHPSLPSTSLGSRVEPDTVLPVRIALTQSNLEFGREQLLDISSPLSPNYGRHWTAEQVRDTFAPSEEAVRDVTAWLTSSGVPQDQIFQSDNKVWLAINMPARQAEALFHAQYYEQETGNGKVQIGCDSYSVPRDLAEHINYIKPGVITVVTRPRGSLAKDALAKEKLALPRTAPSASQSDPTDSVKRAESVNSPAFRQLVAGLINGLNVSLASTAKLFAESAQIIQQETVACDQIITPTCVRALYNIPAADAKLSSNSINDLGIEEDNEDPFVRSDFEAFSRLVDPSIPANTVPKLENIDGGDPDTSEGAGESMLDFELAIPLLYPQQTIIYQEGNVSNFYGSPITQALLEAVDGSYCTAADRAAGNDCGTLKLTRVLSISYDGSELSVPLNFAQSACNEIMKLSLQGHTFVEASGDLGVAANTGSCVQPGHVVHSVNYPGSYPNAPVFNTDFWSSCPYILSVGGSELANGSSIHDSEISMGGDNDTAVEARFGSTGGFSNYFPAPKWQQSTLNAYFAQHDPGYKTYKYNGSDSSIGVGGGIYNRIGRGFPDVAANGNNILEISDGIASLNGGTSAAAPIMASVITRINQERTAAGKGPVGYVNPVFYAHPEMFNDITDGNNPGCNTGGFKAVKGWDPVTGLGTPNYPKMLKVFMSLP